MGVFGFEFPSFHLLQQSEESQSDSLFQPGTVRLIRSCAARCPSCTVRVTPHSCRAKEIRQD
eukprot:m.21387 g.21387  ORF g.21387 m.21387 type:complete len:62 (+) comp5681_c0_seq1:1664-1849(+)